MIRLTTIIRQLCLVIVTILINFTLTTAQPSPGKKIAVKEALDKVSELFGTKFVYERRTIKNKTTTVDVTAIKNQPFEDILKGILYPNNLLFLYVDRNHYTVVPKSSRAETSQPSANSSVDIPVSNATITTGNNPLNIRGSVIDSLTNKPLAGVTVSLKGTSTGDVTDNNGRFTINSRNASNPVLEFSMIGYEKKQLSVDGKSDVSIVLGTSASALDEVVVVGYGTQSKKFITSAVSSVKGKEIQNLPVASPLALLQGRTAGVQIVQNNGAPGPTNFTIRVRGITSINAGNNPLLIIDGMPVEGSSSDINANDVESMEILKDAAATAIYGSRGANGVILVTTKRGKAGRTAINFNAYTSLQQIDRARLPKLMNSTEFIELIQEQRANGTGITSLYAFVLPDAGAANTNWIGEIEQKGAMDNYEISASGGESKLKFYLSGGLLKQKGTIIHTNYKRYSSKLNLDYEASPKFKMGTNVTLSTSDRNDIQQEFGVIQSAIFKAPVMPVYNADGTYFINDVSNTLNPVAVADLEKYLTKTFRFIGNAFGEYSILPNLKLRSSWGIDINNRKFDAFIPSNARRNQVTNGRTSFAGGSNWVNENTLSYLQNFKNHRLNGLLGYSKLENRNESLGASARDFATNNITTLNAAITPLSATSNKSANGISSLFGRLGYTFNETYIAEVSLRRDGSSKFGKDFRYAMFPAASIGWRIGNEPFFKKFTSAINDLKLRGSYGKTGNQAGIGDYTAQGLFRSDGGYLGQSGVYPGLIPNANLKWETTDQYNLGADISILKSHVTLNVDVYLKKTSNLLLNVLLPSSSGYSSALQNIGNTQNKGLEINVNTININRKNLQWNSNFNITFNKNKVVKLFEGNEIINSEGNGGYGSASSLSIIREGLPIGSFFGWQSTGVYATSSDNKNVIRNSNATGYIFRGGDMIFTDQNGDNVINDNDRVVIGNALPKFTGGLTNTIQYKNLELNMLAQFTYGNDVYNGTRAISESMSLFQNGTKSLLSRWRKEGDVTDIPRADHNDPGINKRPSTRWIEDGSYLRIKTLTLSYNVSQQLLNTIKIKSLRLYATAQNLLTFTNYTGIDPEANTFVNSVTDIGIDYAAYPQYRSFYVGINVGF